MKTLLVYTDFGFRVLVLALCLTFGIVFLIAGARAALAAKLRPVSVVTDSVLRVGDIFEGLSEEKAKTVLGASPMPGKEMVLDTATLMRIAKATDMDWAPATTADKITVRRDATVIGKDVVESLIKEKLFENGLTGDYKLSLGSISDIILPKDMPAQAEVSKFTFNAQKDIFEATVSAPSATNPAFEMTVAGSIDRMVKIPVLRNTLKNGDIIGKNDIEMIDVLQKDVQRDYVIKEDAMNGMTPRRMVVAGKPIRDMELENPQIVGRGAAVTLVYKSGPMTLSARGKSMQGGARGDMVRVVNMNSNRSLEGIITAENEVTVTAMTEQQ